MFVFFFTEEGEEESSAWGNDWKSETDTENSFYLGCMQALIFRAFLMTATNCVPENNCLRLYVQSLRSPSNPSSLAYVPV